MNFLQCNKIILLSWNNNHSIRHGVVKVKKILVFDIKNFSKFKDKIIYIIIDKLPDGLHQTNNINDIDEKGNRIIDNTLLIEHTQRNSILRGLKG